MKYEILKVYSRPQDKFSGFSLYQEIPLKLSETQKRRDILESFSNQDLWLVISIAGIEA